WGGGRGGGLARSLGSKTQQTSRISRGQAQQGIDRPQQGRGGLHRRRGHRLHLPERAGPLAKQSTVQDRILTQRVRFQRSHLFHRQKDSRAFLLLRIALGLSQALGHLGEDQRRRRRAFARYGGEGDRAIGHGGGPAGIPGS